MNKPIPQIDEFDHIDEFQQEIEDMIKDYNQTIINLTKDRDKMRKERNILVALLARIFPSSIKLSKIKGFLNEYHNHIYINIPLIGLCRWTYNDSEIPLFEPLPNFESNWEEMSDNKKYENITNFLKKR